VFTPRLMLTLTTTHSGTHHNHFSLAMPKIDAWTTLGIAKRKPFRTLYPYSSLNRCYGARSRNETFRGRKRWGV